MSNSVGPKVIIIIGMRCCHTKRRMGWCGRAHLSFGMTPTFQKREEKNSKKLVLYEKKDGRGHGRGAQILPLV